VDISVDKITKRGVGLHVLWLTMSGYELFERPSYSYFCVPGTIVVVE